ncbi:Calmodulin-binding receptor-like cytoplasmic kinase 3 [Zea mays]|uniref:Calmodulin-binding receptor-like cytoplasmic kinase 3 n=1 Tax=Zea mays TaxID=4577 RepID=A0A1D6KAT5_MAIZE|nr:Calmodulin-binding receptor-like cytoplasmic kinase 3 [Zea mays]ONM00517.1 Calmodulin-binding receptor-like cytoplasmic kinase 3 [Zea mays]ONM00526.1 Calmodulin-binding receptor-like cytoplasmic kinase 3 [Zea mays]
MSPLALLQALIFILCCSPLASASSSELTLAGAACGDDQLVIFDASDGLLNLSVNGVLMQDRVFACQKLGFYFGSGCLRCSNLSDAWRSAVKQYCGEGSEKSHATLHQDVPRKLLRWSTENSSRNACERSGLNENNQDIGDSSEKQEHLLAVPGVILLCCGLMLPCFHAERKEVSRHDNATIQRNAREFIFQLILFLLSAPSFFSEPKIFSLSTEGGFSLNILKNSCL